MPHVVIEGPVSMEDIFQSIELQSIRLNDGILKVRDALCNLAKTKILLDCVVVEDGISQSFYVAVTQKGAKTSVHLDALTDPEKNDGIKQLLAHIAQLVKSQDASCRYVTHNLHGFLQEEGVSAQRRKERS